MLTVHQGGIAAADINSRRTGVAFGLDEHAPAPRCYSWQLFGCKDKETLIRSSVALYDSVYELCCLTHPKIFAIEAPLDIPDRNPVTGMALTALAFTAATAASKGGARVIFGHVSTVRKHFVGRGNLSKDEAEIAVAERCRLLGWNAANHDEADSIALWSWAMATHFPKWSPRSTPLFGRPPHGGARAGGQA